jgi:hypothetical protein
MKAVETSNSQRRRSKLFLKGRTMKNEDSPSCGKGLAEHSLLPAKLGEITASVAEVLEAHTLALDLGDPNAKQEYAAYLELVKEHRRLAQELNGLAERMSKYRDLPIARHNEEVMLSTASLAAFERFVKLERELSELLEHRLTEDQKMLIEMVAAAPVGASSA